MEDIHWRLWLNSFVTLDTICLDLLVFCVRFREIGVNRHQPVNKVIKVTKSMFSVISNHTDIDVFKFSVLFKLFCRFTCAMFVKYKFCSLVTCPVLHLSNGGISYNKSPLNNGGYPIGTVASFSCNYGYSQTQSNSRTCQTSGMWNQQTPTCNQCKLFCILHSVTQFIFCSIICTKTVFKIFLL